MENQPPSPTWPQTIEDWINGLGLGEEAATNYIKLFKEQEVTIAVLPTFSQQDLIDVGVQKVGARKSMLKSIEDYKAAKQALKSKEGKSEIKVKEEKAISPPIVSVSTLDCDLDFTCTATPDGIVASPNERRSYNPIWVGGRATRGVYKGKHWFEFTITELLPDTHVSDSVGVGKYGCRVGWSTLDTPVHLLGDTPDSFAFDMTGTRVTNKDAVTYGEPWNVNDALGCFLDLDLFTVSYSRNGVWLQIANVIPEEFHGKFFFPHVLLKNVKSKINFGERQSVTPVPQGYEWLTEAASANAVEGPRAPASKQECEAILLVGLPLSGKTTFARKLAKEHPEKHYTILGPDHVLEHMKPWLFPTFADEENKEKKEEKLRILRTKSYAMANNALLGMLKRVDALPRNIIIDTGRVNTFLATLRKRYYNDLSNPAPGENNNRYRWSLSSFFGGFGKKIAYVLLTPIPELKKRTEEFKALHPSAPESRFLVRPGRLVKQLPLSTEYGFDDIHYETKEEVEKAIESYKEAAKTEPEPPERINKKRGRQQRRGRNGRSGRGRGRKRVKGDPDQKDVKIKTEKKITEPEKKNEKDTKTPIKKENRRNERRRGGGGRRDSGRGRRDSGRYNDRSNRSSYYNDAYRGSIVPTISTAVPTYGGYYNVPIQPQPIIIQAPVSDYGYRREEDRQRSGYDRYDGRTASSGGSGRAQYLPPSSSTYPTSPVVYTSSSYYSRY